MWAPNAKPLSLCQWVSPGNTLILPSQLQTGNPSGTLWNSPLQLCLADTSSKLPCHQRVTLAGTTKTQWWTAETIWQRLVLGNNYRGLRKPMCQGFPHLMCTVSVLSLSDSHDVAPTLRSTQEALPLKENPNRIRCLPFTSCTLKPECSPQWIQHIPPHRRNPRRSPPIR